MAAKHSAPPTSYNAFFHSLDPKRSFEIGLGSVAADHRPSALPALSRAVQRLISTGSAYPV
jgi:hypothetical protein